MPLKSDAFSFFAVVLFDPAAFSAEEFVAGQGGGILAGEPHPVHLTSHIKARTAVGPLGGLRLDQGRRAVERSSAGVEAHALLAHPHHAGPAVTEQAHRLMGDAGTGAEQQRPDRRGRDVGRAVGVLGRDGVVFPVQDATFQVDEGDTVSHPSELTWRGLAT
jgi:hypothetical protein